MSNSLCDAQRENATAATGNVEVRHLLYSTIITTIVFNGFLCYTTLMINVVTIHALRKTSFPEKPSKTLLLSLTISDLGVGLLGQPLYIVEQVEKLRCNVTDNATSIVSATVHNLLFLTSFGSIMAISVNRFVAIQMPLRYQDIVTRKRAVIAVATVWLSSAIFILCTLFCAPTEYRFRNFCHYRISLLYCYNAVFLQDIFRFKTAQKWNSSSETTSCAKWQHGKYWETQKVCPLYILDLSRILGLLSPLYYYNDYRNVVTKYDHGSVVYVLWNHSVTQFVIKPHHLLLEDETCSSRR